jgi:hypothetical protein
LCTSFFWLLSSHNAWVAIVSLFLSHIYLISLVAFHSSPDILQWSWQRVKDRSWYKKQSFTCVLWLEICCIGIQNFLFFFFFCFFFCQWHAFTSAMYGREVFCRYIIFFKIICLCIISCAINR